MNGKNIVPTDLEFTVQEQIDTLRKGCIAAVGVTTDGGTEEVAILAESALPMFEKKKQNWSASEGGALSSLSTRIRSLVAQYHPGVEVAQVIIMPQRKIPKTTSGKQVHRGKAGIGADEWKG